MSQKRLTTEAEPFYLVRTLAAAVPAGHATGRHAHAWHQLIYARSGVMNVWTTRGTWIVPPHWALWVPAGTAHEIRCVSESALHTLYLAPAWVAHLPEFCGVITVSPLLRALIDRATHIGALDSRDAAEAAIALLILEELRRGDAPPFDVPQPHSAALRRVATRAMAAPHLSIAALAQTAGLSGRTLERRFLAETGMTLGRWRRQASLLACLERLAAGASVKEVAASSAYATPSAFVASFREAFGTTPGRYFGRNG